MKTRKSGFTMIELVVALGIIGILATIAIPRWAQSAAKSRRSEAELGIDSIWTAQRAYVAEYSQFAPSFTALGWAIDGGTSVSATEIQAKKYDFQVSQPSGSRSWYAQATGDIDGDAWTDQLAIEETATSSMRSPQIVYDDLMNSYSAFTIAVSTPTPAPPTPTPTPTSKPKK